MYKIPDSFMEPFIVRKCPECGLEHALIRTCEETVRWASVEEQ